VKGLQATRRTVTAAGLGLITQAALPRLARAQTPRVIRFSWWGGSGRHAATLKALSLFESRHPGVRVKAEYMGFNGYLERLTTQIAGRNEPDVMQVNWAWVAMFSKRGTGFYDLNQARDLLDLKQFSPSDLQTGLVQDKLNGLPASFSARVLIWNHTSFQRAGLQTPQNWDDLFNAGGAFQSRLGRDYYPIDGELYDMVLLSQALVEQTYGTPFLSPSEPRVAMSQQAAELWVETYLKLVRQKTAVPLPLRASLGGAEKPTEQQQDWVKGRWAGNYAWDSTIPLRLSTLTPEQRIVLGAFPMLTNAKASGLFGRPTLMYTASRNTREPELSCQLINFLLTDPEAAAILGRTRGIPAPKSSQAALLKAIKIPELEWSAYQQIRDFRDRGLVAVPSMLFEHARMQKFMREVFETVAYGKSDARTAATRLTRDGESLLRRIR
jgi:oligogalacturonide transport system substrate-binding protein